MYGGSTNVNIPFLVRTFPAGGKSRASDKTVDAVNGVGCGRIAQADFVGVDICIGGFDLRFHIEVVCNIEAPAEFTRNTVCRIVQRSFLVCSH